MTLYKEKLNFELFSLCLIIGLANYIMKRIKTWHPPIGSLNKEFRTYIQISFNINFKVIN